MYLHVHRLTSELKRGTARIMAVTGQEADERVGNECASLSILRLLSFTFRQAPYCESEIVGVRTLGYNTTSTAVLSITGSLLLWLSHFSWQWPPTGAHFEL